VIAAAFAALKGLGIAQRLWAHRAWLKWAATGLVVALLLGLWRWERHDRLAAEAMAEAARAARDLAQADAGRWHAASDLRDAAITGLNHAIAVQNTAVRKLQFSLDQANAAAARAEAASRDARGQFDQRMKELDDAAKAHPEEIAPLGRLVRDRVDRLWD
jgi:hypothetical protein